MSQILVIDDDPTIRQMCKAYFTVKGHVVTLAKDGKEGLDKFKGGRFDVVITALMMPGVHGFQVIDYVKKSPRGKSTAVLLLTADKDDPELQGYDRHAFQDDTLTKPFDMPILERKVQDLLVELQNRAD
jgi:CheY-like chemotaxis protein